MVEMGLSPINSQLANMEFMLYGGSLGLNPNVPSIYNGYRAGGQFNNPSLMGGYGYNPAMNGYNPYAAANSVFSNPQAAAATAAGVGAAAGAAAGVLSQSDLDVMGDFFIKDSAPSESFAGAAIGGAAFGLMNNMRLIAHPWNSLAKALKPTAQMFTDIGKEGSALRALWQDSKSTKVVMEAYGQMHKLHGAMNSRLGLFKARLSGDALTKANNVISEMKVALSQGNAQRIAELSEEARRLTNAKTGYIPRAWRAIGGNKPYQWVKESLKGTSIGNMFGIGAPKQTVAEAAAKSVADKAASSTLGGALKHSCGIGNGLAFAAFDFAGDLLEGKIQAAFDKDKATGYKQLAQTATKGVGSAVGWAVGEGIGTWAGAWAAMKIGAITGSAVAPGVGTAIGAIAGLVGGSIGCWLTGKITHKLIGKEAGTEAKVEKMKKTQEGQAELIQLAYQKAQTGEAPQEVVNSLNNIIRQVA